MLKGIINVRFFLPFYQEVPFFAKHWKPSLVLVVESVFEMHCSTEGGSLLQNKDSYIIELQAEIAFCLVYCSVTIAHFLLCRPSVVFFFYYINLFQ